MFSIKIDRLRILPRHRGFILLLALLPCFSQLTAQKEVVIIAGHKSHGPEGNRIHDYPWSARLLKTMLENSNIRDQVLVSTYFNGWPTDNTAVEHADALMIISDGRDGTIGREAPHLERPESIETVSKLMEQGKGILAFHFSTFAPDRLANEVINWVGGYFDWETNQQRDWYSAIDTLEAQVIPADPSHPILSGVQAFHMKEEFYYNIRFQPNDPGWKPIWSVPALPTDRNQGKVVAWAVQRPSGSRGFATTCGHFYDNWKHKPFRKTLLNAIAWTAKVKIPRQGVSAPFFDREAIKAHLSGKASSQVFTPAPSADETVYKNEPYWYKPGHPVDPTDAAKLRTLPGFVAERILSVPRDFGSFTALTVDPQGRLLAAAQHRAGIYRVTPPTIGSSDSGELTKIEKLGGVAEQYGWSHGLLHAFGSLYITVTEKNDSIANGVHRLDDTNGDGVFDQASLLFKLDGSGEHGAHNIVIHPDRKSLTLIAGNGTPLPKGIVRTRPTATSGFDHAMPPGYESSTHTSAGWVMRFLPDGSQREIICTGLRNSFDLAYNDAGDLFTFDSDMEWDLGTPWYRPTRICHLVSGGEFGWRGGAAKWPDHYEDSVAPVVNIGPASPTGIAFGYGTRFPEKYQRALFVCDWTFATIHAVHLHPSGASYNAEVEEFIGGNGLPLTDIAVGNDGALYFSVGGRRLGSALYRVTHQEHQNILPIDTKTNFSPEQQHHQQMRRSLEQYHGQEAPTSLDLLWPHLGHSDRAIRFAARVALEAQPVSDWRQRALKEENLQIALTALLALARQESQEQLDDVITRLNHMSWDQLATADRSRALRILELAYIRTPRNQNTTRTQTIQQIQPLFPSGEASLNHDLARLLCHLGDSSIMNRILTQMRVDNGHRPLLGSGYFVRNPKYGKAVKDMLEAAPMINRMHFAQMALWLRDQWSSEERQHFVELVAHAKSTSRGGHGYLEIWDHIAETAIEPATVEERKRLQTLLEELNPPIALGLPSPAGPGREWSLEEALTLVREDSGERNIQNGQRTFAAAGCILCHRVDNQGGSAGPDLSSLGQRFTLRDILEATISPSRAISDQYRVTTLELNDGSTLSGRLVSRDTERTLVATDLMQPLKTTSVPNTMIRASRAEPVSLMPSGLLDSLNSDELLDLLAFLSQ